MVRSMRFGSSIPFTYRATFARSQGSAAGLRPTTVWENWPCELSNITQEMPLPMGFETATHMLAGPIYNEFTIEAGDQVTVLTAASGYNHVRAGKTWSVVGRQHLLGQDSDHQEIYVKEPR